MSDPSLPVPPVEDPVKKTSTAKFWSLMSKILGGVVLLVGAVLIGLGVFPGMTVTDLIYVVVALVSIFGTVDINLMLEKFVKMTEARMK